MELDTGASLSIINYSTFNKLQKNDKRLSLNQTQAQFRTYSDEMIAVLGSVQVNVEHKYEIDLNRQYLFSVQRCRVC